MKERKKPPGLSRRDVLAGAATVALAAGAASAFGIPRASPRKQAGSRSKVVTPLRRYMAASTPLGDGRILVTGGYDRPWTDSAQPVPLRSALVLDPASGRWEAIASMTLPRARHAAVTLGDGRVAVLGGIGAAPLASVEIYDPATNEWHSATPLSLPRYDHNAVAEGSRVYVLGGSGQAVLSTLETVDF